MLLNFSRLIANRGSFQSESAEPAVGTDEPVAAAAAPVSEAAGGVAGPLSTVIRSKGFVWLATHHVAAVYWSHAGKALPLLCVFHHFRGY